MDELTEAEREALAGLAEALSCSQCGFPFSHRACGFTHAIVGHDPRQHRLIAPLLAAREEAAHAAGVAEGRAEIAAAVNALVSGWESWGGQVSQECAAMVRDALADPHDYRDDATAIGDSTGYGGPA